MYDPKTNRLSSILWLWVPAIAVIAQICVEIFVPYSLKGPLHSEGGPHETIQFLTLLMALGVALSALFRLQGHDRLLSTWIGLAALCCVYVAGEEVSWGQHIFDWATPEFWRGINDQNETNLHNTSSWLDQKPRLLLLIGVVVGGLVIPTLQRFKPSMLPTQFAAIYPPGILGVTAALALGSNLIDKAFEAFTGYPILSRGSEIEEIFLFYFVLLYLMTLHRNTLHHQR